MHIICSERKQGQEAGSTSERLSAYALRFCDTYTNAPGRKVFIPRHQAPLFSHTCCCKGQKTDGEPCDMKCMLLCRFCPFTNADSRLQKFAAWRNPIASNGTKTDMARFAEGHVEGARGWHAFWYAVHALTNNINGVSCDEECMMADLDKKAPDYLKSRKYFESPRG